MVCQYHFCINITSESYLLHYHKIFVKLLVSRQIMPLITSCIKTTKRRNSRNLHLMISPLNHDCACRSLIGNYKCRCKILSPEALNRNHGKLMKKKWPPLTMWFLNWSELQLRSVLPRFEIDALLYPFPYSASLQPIEICVCITQVNARPLSSSTFW